jgi:hypothetical protein
MVLIKIESRFILEVFIHITVTVIVSSVTQLGLWFRSQAHPSQNAHTPRIARTTSILVFLLTAFDHQIFIDATVTVIIQAITNFCHRLIGATC